MGVPHVDITGDAVCAIVCVALAVIFSVNDCDDICVLAVVSIVCLLLAC